MSISTIASSGMQVAALRQQVAASNVARQPVEGSPARPWRRARRPAAV